MSEGTQMVDSRKGPQKRKRTKSNKKLKTSRDVAGMKVKVDWRMKKLFEKRAREYNSDDDEEEEEAEESMGVVRDGNASFRSNKKIEDEDFSEGEGEDELGEGEGNEDWDDEGEDDHIQPGITKFTEGCRAFKMAFKSIIKKTVSDKTLGPVLSAQKKLVAEKLAEEKAERKVKGEAKKEKHLAGEKGHVKPANYLDSHEKFLIGVATKGVVKLFNAVNKAQNAQKGLNPSRFKDEKAIKKRRKEAFFSELGGISSAGAKNPAKVHTSKGAADEGPAWAPLRDSYMLTNSKLKNWDKLPDTTAAAAAAEEDELGPMSEDSSSEDD